MSGAGRVLSELWLRSVSGASRSTCGAGTSSTGTGLSSGVLLWDWLEALAVPVSVALVPVLLVNRKRLHRRHKSLGLGLLTGFAVLALAGYLVPWTWTGFTGNTLWDWLSLALLPLVIATSTLWRSPSKWSRRHRALVLAGTALAVLVVLAGYLVPWDWTGFVGNTVWDWIQLLLLPVLVPILVLPLVVEGTESWVQRQHPEEESALSHGRGAARSDSRFPPSGHSAIQPREHRRW
jgi:hypothetical protein